MRRDHETTTEAAAARFEQHDAVPEPPEPYPDAEWPCPECGAPPEEVCLPPCPASDVRTPPARPEVFACGPFDIDEEAGW